MVLHHILVILLYETTAVINMIKQLIIFMLTIFSSSLHAQEYEFINQVIVPFDETSTVPLDTIYLKNKFIILGNDYINLELLNEETIRFWWDNSYKNPPVELFLENYNLTHLKNDILLSQKDSNIDFSRLNNYFFSVDNQFIKENPKNNYLSISKPFYNCKKDWCFIIKSNSKWVLYNTMNVG